MRKEAGTPVLVAEDDASVRALVGILLEDAGFDVVLAEDGRAALAALDGGASPAIFVVDWMMPGLDGVALIHLLRERLPEVPCILLTGSHPDEAREAAVVAQCDALITKPFDPEDLVAVVERLLAPRAA